MGAQRWLTARGGWLLTDSWLASPLYSSMRLPRFSPTKVHRHWQKRVLPSILLVAIASALSGCPLTVNLNVSTDKPIPVYLIVDKPVEVRLDAGLAVTKVPPIHADVGVSKLPPIRLGL
jgi:hypothetical protein